MLWQCADVVQAQERVPHMDRHTVADRADEDRLDWGLGASVVDRRQVADKDSAGGPRYC